MGCWNKTCAISNLPIRCSEPVIGIFLTNIPGSEPFEYHTPLPFYVEGEYDDYGRIENEHGVALNLLIEGIRAKLDKYELGENTYHDIAVDPEEIDFHGLMEADHEGRLTFQHSNYRTGKKETRKVQHIQIRKDVFDEVIEKFVPGIRRQGDDWSSRGATFAEIMDDYNEFYQKFVDEAQAAKNGGFRMKSVFDEHDNYVSIILKNSYDKSNGIMNIERVLYKMFDDGATLDEMRPFVANAVQTEILSHCLRATHRQWVMPGYAGQEGDTDAHTMFANIVIDIAEGMSNFYDEEDEDDEELIEQLDVQ